MAERRESFQTAVNERLKTGAFCGHPEIHLHVEPCDDRDACWLWLNGARVEIGRSGKRADALVQKAIEEHKDDPPHVFDRFEIDKQLRISMMNILQILPDGVRQRAWVSLRKQMDESETFRERSETGTAFAIEPHEHRELFTIEGVALLGVMNDLNQRALSADARVKELEDFLCERCWPVPGATYDSTLKIPLGMAIHYCEDREHFVSDRHPCPTCGESRRGMTMVSRDQPEPVTDKPRHDPESLQKIVDLTTKDLRPVPDFPHRCPSCGSPAYIGATSVECSREGCGGK